MSAIWLGKLLVRNIYQNAGHTCKCRPQLQMPATTANAFRKYLRKALSRLYGGCINLETNKKRIDIYCQICRERVVPLIQCFAERCGSVILRRRNNSEPVSVIAKNVTEVGSGTAEKRATKPSSSPLVFVP